MEAAIPTTGMPTEPNDGDLIIHCGHMLTQLKHCFYAPNGIKYKRPDGSSRVAGWCICCPDCMKAADGDPSKIKWKADGVWEKNNVGGSN
jgi:hypothetical protein